MPQHLSANGFLKTSLTLKNWEVPFLCYTPDREFVAALMLHELSGRHTERYVANEPETTVERVSFYFSLRLD